jgi:hydroxyacylglutathione hydrolase
MNIPRLSELCSITPIEAFNDNYIWCLHNTKYAVVVDPGDAAPVMAFCQQHKLILSAILITHHHSDHVGGIAALSHAFPAAPIIGPRGSHIKGLTKTVAQGDTIHLATIDGEFSVLELPGHTLDHIGFYGHGALFCGDTLFSAGCGRLFEGTPEQMHHSLNKLKRLPSDTQVYCTHEYTLANIAFALAVEPSNEALIHYKDWATEQREHGHPTLPTDMQTQANINPFLRCNETEVIASVQEFANRELAGEIEVFTHLRKWKDSF